MEKTVLPALVVQTVKAQGAEMEVVMVMVVEEGRMEPAMQEVAVAEHSPVVVEMRGEVAGGCLKAEMEVRM